MADVQLNSTLVKTGYHPFIGHTRPSAWVARTNFSSFLDLMIDDY